MSEKLDQPSDRLLVRGIHILGAARCSTIYRPLIDFLRGPEDIIEDLGDATTETVSQILAGVFDGDSSLLKGLITDVKADEYVRNAAFGALAFLTFEDRIARDDTADFLRRFAEEDTSPAASLAWDGWMAAVGLLGLDELTPRVLAAFADDRIPSYMSEEKHYRELLEQAAEASDRSAAFPQRTSGLFGGHSGRAGEILFRPGGGDHAGRNQAGS